MKTVESYQAHIKEKLSLCSARELVQHAIQWSIKRKDGLKTSVASRVGNARTSSSNNVDPHADAEVPPRSICCVNGGVKGNSESQASPVPEGQTERAGVGDEISGCLGMVRGEGDRLVNRSIGRSPSIFDGETSLKELPMHFSEIHGTGGGIAQDLRRQLVCTSLAIDHRHERRRIQHNPTHVWRLHAVRR